MSSHARHRQPLVRPLAMFEIAAGLPRRIGHDRLTPNLVKSDILRGMARGRGDDQRRGGAVREIGGQRQRLHSAHRPADNGMQPVYAQCIKQLDLGANHVANGDDRKAHAIGLAIGRKACRPGRAHAAAKNIRADHEKAIGVHRQSGSDRTFPPAGLSGDRMAAGDILIHRQRMAQQDRVAAVRVQRAIGLISDLYAFELLPAIEQQRFAQD